MAPVALMVLATLASGPLAEERLLVSAATPLAAWSVSQGAEPPEIVPDPDRPGEQVIRLPYTLTGTTQRAAWDVTLSESLVGAGKFEAQLWLDRPELVSGISLYFEAPPGWYGAWFGAETPEGKPAWRTLRWTRAAMNPESPGPWSAGRALRVSIWQAAPGSGALLLRPVTARGSAVLLVAPRWMSEQEPERADEARPWIETVAGALDRTGIPYGELDDTDLDAATLAGARMLILPYAPRLAPELLDALPGFLERGGRALAFYQCPEPLLRALGVLEAEYRSGREGDGGRFARVAFTDRALTGLPESMGQNSWNAIVPTRLAPEARAIGLWQSVEGALGEPACILSPAGAYLGHVLTRDDPAAKAAFLGAVIGDLIPEAWEAAYGAQRESLTAVGPYRDEAELAEAVRASGNATATELLDAGLAKLVTADDLAGAGQWAEAATGLQGVRDDLVRAWATSLPAREDEFRAVWCHSAFGVDGWGWEHSLDALRDAGFTAVIPNMLWGGVAFYPSQVLPVSLEVTERGDQIAQCVEAAHARGLAVHVWKVNYCLGPAPEEFIARLRAEGRLQIDREGRELRDPHLWLCPSQQANFELERDAMLEAARNYEVDGLHFDYIRYPGQDGCFCPACRRAFEATLGRAVANWPADVADRGGPLVQQWYEFRRQQIDRLVGSVAEEAREIRPGIAISAAVWPDLPRTRDSIGQDWDRWIDRGWLDFVCPMDYTKEADSFRGMVTRQAEWIGGRIPFYPGIGCHEASPDGLLEQITIAREKAPGFTVFNFDAGLAQDYLPLCSLGATRR